MEENLNFLEVKNYTEAEVRELSPLALAYIGDACFEILVRSEILDVRKNPNKLHRESIRFVRAKSQRELFEKIEENLTEEEIKMPSPTQFPKTQIPLTIGLQREWRPSLATSIF